MIFVRTTSGRPHTRDSPSSNKHADRLCSGLDDRSGNHDGGADKDGRPSANAIGEVGREWKTSKSADILSIIVLKRDMYECVIRC